jgi:nitrite reductase/ring-hydroxylating ferredoxin subunit
MPTAELSFAGLPADFLVRVEQNGANLVVIRLEGRVFAYHDRCPHAFWPLSQGTLTGAVLECPGHGWEFDISTGRCLNAPAYCLAGVAATVTGDGVYMQWNDDEVQKSCPQNSQDAAQATRS